MYDFKVQKQDIVESLSESNRVKSAGALWVNELENWKEHS